MDYEIRHYGIGKQKWGQRRYQNPDGSYTEEGKARRRKDYVPYDEWSDEAKEYERLRGKDPRTLSNKELDAFTTRKDKLEKYAKANPAKTAVYIASGIAIATTLTQIISTANGFMGASNNFIKTGATFTENMKKMKI